MVLVSVRLPFFKNSLQKGRVGIELGGNKIAMSYVYGSEIEQCVYDFSDSAEDREQVLQSFVSEHQLKGTPASLVLAPRCYQILLTDMPDVDEDEVADALPWKVKDLLHFPLEEVALQHFLLPEDAFSRRQRMLYVVAVQKKLVNQWVDMVEEAGLQVDSIDVPELVLMQSVLKRKDPQKNSAALYIDNTQGILCLGQQGLLYLNRSIDVGFDSLLSSIRASVEGSNISAQLPHENFLLEVQRSLDYYESQQGKGPISEIACSPLGIEGQTVIEFLNEQVSPIVSDNEFEMLFGSGSHLTPEEQQHCFLATGVARRWGDELPSNVVL